MNMNGVPLDIFLPPMAMNDITPLSDTQPTDVVFGAEGLAQLAEMFPDIDPAVWARTKTTVAPGAAIDSQGNAATQAIIIPVPPDRLPGPLPPGLSPELVISIQPLGATNFDVPAPVTFPNLEGLAPGEQTLLFSFNHDAGRWDVTGTATVSEDGLMVVSDPGQGIIAPGWHFTAVGALADGMSCHEEEFEDDTSSPPPKLRVKDRDDKPDDKVSFFSDENQTREIEVKNIGGKVLHVKSPKLMSSGMDYFEVQAADHCDAEEPGVIKIKSKDPSNWKEIKRPTFFGEKLKVESDGGNEDVTLIRMLDRADDSANGTLEFNTTVVGGVRKLNIALLGVAAELTFANATAPFSVEGKDLTFRPTAAGSFAGRFDVHLNGKMIGSVQLAARAVDKQGLHLNRQGFVNSYLSFLQNPPDSPADQVRSILANVFPEADNWISQVNQIFDRILAKVQGYYGGNGLSAALAIDDSSSGLGDVVQYSHQSSEQSGREGDASVDFADASFNLLSVKRLIQSKGQTLFQFGELFNSSLADEMNVYLFPGPSPGDFVLPLNTQASTFSQKTQQSVDQYADGIIHEFIHAVGGHHVTDPTSDRFGRRLSGKPLGRPGE
jgi:hypothetical protein